MARIRTIKPEFWTDALMVQLPHFTRLVYIALWNEADDHGYLPAEIERLAMEIMPKETVHDFDAAFQLLEAAGRIEFHVTDEGHQCYRVARWTDHQRVDHPGKSKISREGSRKLAIPLEVRRAVAIKYGCPPGKTVAANCAYCGHEGSVAWFSHNDGRPSGWVTFPDLELEHVISEGEGGENACENIVLSCRSCNRSKGTTPWIEFMLSRSLANPREGSRMFALDQGSGKGSGKGSKPPTPLLRAVSFRPEACEGLDQEAWARWIEYRKAIKKPLKTPSLAAAAKQMAKLGPGQAAAVEHSIANQYQGLVEPRGAGPSHLTKYERNRLGLYDDTGPPDSDNFLLMGGKP